MADQQPETANGAAATNQPTGAQFSVDKIYVKDVSFESPKAPQVFNEQAQPQLNMNLNQRVTKVGDNGYEVVLVCKTGQTAGGAASRLKKAGFERIYLLDGGITGWQQADLPLAKGRR